MCFVNDYDDGTVIGRKDGIRAKKRYFCDDCTRDIEPGTLCSKWTWIYDGHMSTVRQHERCRRIGVKIYDYVRATGCAPSNSWCPFGAREDWLRGEHLAYDDEKDALVALPMEEVA